MGNSVKRDTKAAEIAEKQQRALELRKRGATYPVISKTMGCALAYAHHLVRSAIEAIPLEDAKEVRLLELERLDRMLSGLEAKGALAGNPRAIDTALRIMERRARLLGLDAPAQMELSGPDGGPIETRSSQDEVLGRLSRIYEQSKKDGALNGHSNGVSATEPGSSGADDPKPDGNGAA